MKKICLHANVLDDRGNGTVIYDYASALKNILGYEVVISSDKNKSIFLERYSQFECAMYNDVSELEKIVEERKIDVLYMTRAGGVEYFPKNCKTAIHCVFSMTEPHGDVYAGVSEWLAKYFKKEKWVPHIINLPKTNETLREELGIPKTDFIIGRLGGYNQFDVREAQEGVFNALQRRSDLWAIFLNTKQFTDHPRAKFLPFSPSLDYKSKFINTCDAMVHGRSDGETFGLAVAEFSSFNKPVFTYDAQYWWYMRAHIDMLGDRGILYKTSDQLTHYLLQIDKTYVNNIDWDRYSIKFSPQNVIQQFDEVFIK